MEGVPLPLAMPANTIELAGKAMAVLKTEAKKAKRVQKDIPIRAKLPKEERLLRAAAKHVNLQIQQLQTGVGVQSNSYR